MRYIHVPLPDEFAGLGHAARLAWVSLCKFADWRAVPPTCYPAREQIAEVLGVSERTITRGIAELKEAGLVSSQSRKDKPPLYTLNPVGDPLRGLARTSAPKSEVHPYINNTRGNNTKNNTNPPSSPDPHSGFPTDSFIDLFRKGGVFDR